MIRSELTTPFLQSTQNMIEQMSGITVTPEGGFYEEESEIVSLGIATLVSFAGKMKGRLLIDMEPSLAIAFASKVNDESYKSDHDYMVLMSVAELNNIVAGDANTVINNQFQLNLRLAPPVIIAGVGSLIRIPKIASMSANCTTPQGKLKVNIAFEGSL
jgi:chemotaxis protein CheX